MTTRPRRGKPDSVQIGAVFPQTEIGDDVGAVRAYAQGVEELGYQHLLAYDHVLGADPEVHKGWSGAYDLHSTFHEPFVLYGYLAACTSLELVTGIIILPQRQTALVAKQAAEVDLLTGGRFRLGVGIGWNRVEYEALGKDFSNRGARSAEQIELLRRLFTEESVTFSGKYETVLGAGLRPLPVQRPIPIWIGANSPAAWRRVGQLADGWFPQQRLGAGYEEAKAIVDAAALEAGRDPASIGIEARLNAGAEDLGELIAKWQAAGATHLSVNTMSGGHVGVDAHLDALRRAAAIAL
jgi:probable F420-dependent oxidoreductase